MENNNQYGMTEMMHHYAKEGNLSFEEAKAKLYENAYIRTVNETLARYCGIDVKDESLLKARVTALLLESNPSANKESMEKKVRNWINKRMTSISRESALQLAFALHLKEKEAEEMMWRLCGEGFHWRDPEDIVWLFALGKGMDYPAACELSERMKNIYKLPKGTAENQSVMTEVIKPEVEKIQTEEELELFFKEYGPLLGTFHNTAFDLFKNFMDLLRSAPIEDNLPEEREMPVNEILATYMYNNLIPRTKRNNTGKKPADDTLKDAIQRNIQQNWPDEFSLARMANREIDVTRKVLILLFLACDGGETDYGYYADGYFAESSPKNIFEDSYARLGSMLDACGFPPIDPRIPFDWMVLYCMVVDDILDIDSNISGFLSKIFTNTDED